MFLTGYYCKCGDEPKVLSVDVDVSGARVYVVFVYCLVTCTYFNCCSYLCMYKNIVVTNMCNVCTSL